MIRDPVFRHAVAAVQTGDLARLRQLLARHPNLAHDRAIEPDCYPRDYFRDPKLLWFVANNPTLMAAMPVNSVEIAEAIIDAGAEPTDLHYTLGLVMTSSEARRQKLQRPLIQLLLERGAVVSDGDMYSALGHAERDSIEALLEGGLPLTAPIAAATGRTRQLPALFASADEAQRHAALSLAVYCREYESARICLEGGADPNRFMVVHTHSSPAHQAAINDDVSMLKLLVKHGARLDVRDTLWNGTPLGWANHERREAALAYLKSVNAP